MANINNNEALIDPTVADNASEQLSDSKKDSDLFSNFSSVSKAQDSNEYNEQQDKDLILADLKTSIPQYYKPHATRLAKSAAVNTNSDDEELQTEDEDDLVSSGPSNHGSLVSSTQDLSSPRSLSGTPDRTHFVRSIDQRFKTRFNSLTSIQSNYSGTGTPRRTASLGMPSADVDQFFIDGETDKSWETMRWTKLRKISNQIFSETAASTYGRPTCLLAAALIAIGTSRGFVLVFDYHQNLKSVIGQNTKATECGEVTSLAVSADFSYIASGYSTGHIFTWDLAKFTTYNIHISPISMNFMGKPSHDGNVEGSRIIHLSFLGKRHSALVSGNDRGMCFSHNTVRSMLGRSVKTRRIMGRYPQPHLTLDTHHKPTAILACSPLPLGTIVQSTDDMCLVAIMTPYILAIVSVFPSPQTEFKTGRPKSVSHELGLSGCLAWFPALKATGTSSETNSRLAYSWSNVLTIMEVVVIKKHESSKSRKDMSLNFTSVKRYIGEEAIVSIQWISRQVSTFVQIY